MLSILLDECLFYKPFREYKPYRSMKTIIVVFEKALRQKQIFLKKRKDIDKIPFPVRKCNWEYEHKEKILNAV